MSERLRVLQIEDSESDAALIIRLIEKAGYQVYCERVEDAGQLRGALANQAWDVIVADYYLPQFDAPAALNILLETGQDIPFIVVSGRMGEDVAVAMMKSGAHDYLLKNNLARLVPAVEREIKEALMRKERRQAEQALRESEERLLRAQRMESVAVLAGGIAHDFNNLLVGIVGNASLAEEMLPKGSPAMELLESIVRSGEQAANLTRQMLAYAGKGRFVLEPVDLCVLVREACALIRGAISKKIILRYRLESDIPPVESDPSQMQQVFMNLAFNASDAIGDRAGVIEIATGEVSVDEAMVRGELSGWDIAPGRHVFLKVRDTGCGMDAATRARIFDPFFTTKFQGRGLGLAAVAGIVRAHKGAIQLTTAPGAGATFRVLIPAMSAGAIAAAPAARSRPAARGGVLEQR